ncbi:DUF3883 domain-containing protein [Gordonia desulfuricans]|uniref:DUF3883 domain-containing protein n=1 Tax=Gordonia desulfuricans TaxID=89051 RepID=A0A7K3LQQ8_9ACTN|nr:DUF3883 domain-containing protein [Gordonia desulfuricans]NDK90411.1 DUF3883 domain-containing protein [Gordonia desulfuricans]
MIEDTRIEKECSMAGQPWTKSDIEILAVEYFTVLEAEIAGVPVVKAEALRRAQQALPTDRTIHTLKDRCYRISEELWKRDLPWVEGWKPPQLVGQSPNSDNVATTIWSAVEPMAHGVRKRAGDVDEADSDLEEAIARGDDPLSTPGPEGGPDAEQVITVSPAGAGFGDPESNRLVEAAAVEKVTDYLEARGYVVTDVGSKKLGWDLTCVGDAGDIHRVEVKGVSGATPTVLLTANEYRSAQEDEGWELAVVTTALDSPCLTFYTAADATAAAAPMVYRLTLPGVQER